MLLPPSLAEASSPWTSESTHFEVKCSVLGLLAKELLMLNSFLWSLSSLRAVLCISVVYTKLLIVIVLYTVMLMYSLIKGMFIYIHIF